MVSRRSRAPQVMAYWLTSAAMAWRAASLISAGAGKSGNPCAMLIAPCCMASRVISRITDSVNRPAFSETRGRACVAARFIAGRGSLLDPAQAAIDGGVARDDLHVLARFGDGNGLDEFRHLVVLPLRLPAGDAVLAGIVGGQGRLLASEHGHQVRQVLRAQAQIVLRLEQHRFAEGNS